MVGSRTDDTHFDHCIASKKPASAFADAKLDKNAFPENGYYLELHKLVPRVSRCPI